MSHPTLLQISGIIGLIISLYFLSVYKGLLQSKKLIPKNVCSENKCSSVLQTNFASVFMVPNFILGIFYYIIIVISAYFNLGSWKLAFLIVSWLVVLFSIYLAWSLIFRLRTNCILCFASHVVNIAIALIYTF